MDQTLDYGSKAPFSFCSDDRSSGAEETKDNPSEKLASDVWNEIRKVSEDVSSRLQKSESFKKALDALNSPLKSGKPQVSDWTIAIDFTTDFGDSQGVESGLNMLNDFAARTKNKNVTIVAQAAFPDTTDFDDLGYPIINSDTKYKIDRYVIKNGSMERIETADSKGYAADLKALLQYTTKNHPSTRIGLIMDSHGSGNEGLTGDTGHASVDEFVSAVKDGLKDSGREKLDMLDFDSCLMAQDGAMQRIRNVADQVVASAETEGIYNAQNYLDPIARLMEKPTDGFTLARDIVSQTHKDMQDWKLDGWHPAVETLSHFNMRQYDNFQKSLDQFGERLTSALENPNNRLQIESAIDCSRKYGSSGNLIGLLFGTKLGGKHRADLKDFTERIISGIDSGEILDPDRSLKMAAQEVLNRRSSLVDSYHGEGEYKNAGGISVFLPGRNLRNVSKEAEQKTSAGRMSAMTESKQFDSLRNNEKSRNEFVNKMHLEMFFTRPNFLLPGIQGVDGELKEIDRHLDAFTKAKDNEEREKSFRDLHRATVSLAKTNPFKKLHEQETKVLTEKVAKVYKANFIEETKESGWSKFRLKLKN